MEQNTDNRFIHHVFDWVEYVSIGIEVLAVAIITIAILYATVSYASAYLGRRLDATTYGLYRRRIGEPLLLGLEILVAADVIRTVILDLTIESVAVLGVLVLIRTFLTWSLVVEMEGHWPWQRELLEDDRRGSEIALTDTPID
jgi:uncharacterized membrane protein